MATNKQRRDAERLRLQRQLEQRRQREKSRRTATVVGAIVGTLVVIGLVAGLVVLIVNSGDDPKPKKSAAASAPAQTTGPPPCGQEQFAPKKVTAAKGAAVSFQGVTVKGAADLKGKPGVTSKSAKAPAKLAVKDLVTGTGKTAGPTSCVTIQYDGVLYKNGTEFDSSWKRGTLAQFSLAQVVPGFTQGIGGTSGVAPMKVGGRRIIVLPAALGYGAQGRPPVIPANSPLVFVVDLVKVTAG